MPIRSTSTIPSALLALAGGALLSSCAPVARPITEPAPEEKSAAAAERTCFFARQITGFRNAPRAEGGASRIYVDVGTRDTYLFETFGSCPDLRWARGIAFDTVGPGRICDGLDVDLIVPDPDFGPRRCPVRMVRKLAKDEPGAR